MDINYELCEGAEILQGDLIEKYPILTIPDISENSNDERESESTEIGQNIIILTQSCDIVNDPPSHILVSLYNYTSVLLEQYETQKRLDDFIKELKKDRYYQLKYLPPCEIEGYIRKAMIVDFSKIEKVSLDSIKKHVSTIPKRIRLRSPLREYISQTYAISIMRVALQEEIPIKHAVG
ncbi:hypothetical protein ES703_46939 [subsurface metagenome]